MPDQRVTPVGLMVAAEVPPERLASLAQRAEAAGFSEIWMPEDYFFTGGMTGVTIALGATDRIKVGTGIVSAVARHPAVLAMETATLARAFPGRFTPGIGLGVPLWLDQMGIRPKSGLTAVRETFEGARALLVGEEVTREGRYFSFDGAKLVHPPAEPVQLFAGLMGPKMCRLAGQVADGLIIGATAGTPYIAWARERIAEGAAEIGRDVSHFRFPTFVIYSVDSDGQRAKQVCRKMVAFYLGVVGRSAYSDTLGISDEMVEILDRGGIEALEREMPADWVEQLSISGEPDECAEKIRHWHEAGADTVVLSPMPVDRAEELVELTAAEVLPRLSGVLR